MPTDFTEDLVNTLNDISKIFLCGADIKGISWNVLTKHIEEQTDPDAAQLLILESTVLHHLSIKYPLRKSYCRFFLKTLISEIESQNIEVADKVYTTYCNILQENSEEEYHYRHFQLPDKSFVTLKESSKFISEGTTGLYTWQGALALAEWCINNKELLHGSHLLELGSGAGLTGIVVASICAPATFCFSDCHPGVIQLLEHNIKLNETAVNKNSSISYCNKDIFIRSTHAEVLQIDWEEISEIHLEPNPDIVLAADVVYDQSLFTPLINTLKHFLTSSDVKAVLACTVRNPDTLSQFLMLLESNGLTAVEESQVKPCIFTFSLDTPIRIFIVHNGGDSSSVRSRWNNIRDNYRKSLKKLASKSGQCAKKVKVYKYSDQLSFLNKYFDERETIGNINSQKDELENQDNDTQHHEEEEEKETHEKDLASQSSPSPKRKNISESVEKPTRRKAATTKVTAQQTASAKLMEYLI